MNGVWLRLGLAACAAFASGCISSRTTRLPTLGWGDPKSEARSYSYHDPLAERETGPFVERPRAMDRQRPEARRTLEHYEETELMTRPTGYRSSADSAAHYPDSVTP
jgi:hypothetical protein